MGLRNPTDDDAALAFDAHDRALREAHKEIERLGAELNFARDGLRGWEKDALLAMKQRDAAEARTREMESERDTAEAKLAALVDASLGVMPHLSGKERAALFATLSDLSAAAARHDSRVKAEALREAAKALASVPFFVRALRAHPSACDVMGVDPRLAATRAARVPAVHALYLMPDGKLFEDYIQPDDQTAAMRDLHEVSQAAHRSMTSAVFAALKPKRKAGAR